MANLLRFKITNPTGAVTGAYVRVVDLARNEIIKGNILDWDAEGDAVLPLADKGVVGESVLIYGDLYDGTNKSTFMSFSGTAVVEDDGVAPVLPIIEIPLTPVDIGSLANAYIGDSQSAVFNYTDGAGDTGGVISTALEDVDGNSVAYSINLSDYSWDKSKYRLALIATGAGTGLTDYFNPIEAIDVNTPLATLGTVMQTGPQGSTMTYAVMVSTLTSPEVPAIDPTTDSTVTLFEFTLSTNVTVVEPEPTSTHFIFKPQGLWS